MTREVYYEMCAALGSTPIEEEIPVEFEDFPILVQTAISMYNSLRDDWDYMAGNYVGKSLINLFEMFELYNIEEHEKLMVYKILSIVDNERRKLIRAKNKS